MLGRYVQEYLGVFCLSAELTILGKPNSQPLVEAMRQSPTSFAAPGGLLIAMLITDWLVETWDFRG
jgi:hypothetical protein